MAARTKGLVCVMPSYELFSAGRIKIIFRVASISYNGTQYFPEFEGGLVLIRYDFDVSAKFLDIVSVSEIHTRGVQRV